MLSIYIILDVECVKGSWKKQLIESGCDFVEYIWLVTDVQYPYPIPAGLSEAMTKRIQGL